MREAVYLNDVMETSEFLDEPREMVQQQNQPDLIAQTGRKRSRSHSFNQFSDAEEPDYRKKKPRILVIYLLYSFFLLISTPLKGTRIIILNLDFLHIILTLALVTLAGKFFSFS